VDYDYYWRGRWILLYSPEALQFCIVVTELQMSNDQWRCPFEHQVVIAGQKKRRLFRFLPIDIVHLHSAVWKKFVQLVQLHSAAESPQALVSHMSSTVHSLMIAKAREEWRSSRNPVWNLLAGVSGVVGLVGDFLI